MSKVLGGSGIEVRGRKLVSFSPSPPSKPFPACSRGCCTVTLLIRLSRAYGQVHKAYTQFPQSKLTHVTTTQVETTTQHPCTLLATTHVPLRETAIPPALWHHRKALPAVYVHANDNTRVGCLLWWLHLPNVTCTTVLHAVVTAAVCLFALLSSVRCVNRPQLADPSDYWRASELFLGLAVTSGVPVGGLDSVSGCMYVSTLVGVDLVGWLGHGYLEGELPNFPEEGVPSYTPPSSTAIPGPA